VKSLRARLFVVWVLALAAALAVGMLLVQLYRHSSEALAARAETTLARSCEDIANRYGYYVAGWAGPRSRDAEEQASFRKDMISVISVALADAPGVEGGMWQNGTGSLAYAFPTYEGTGPKTDLPLAERDRIAQVNLQAAQDGGPVTQSYQAGSQTLLLHACPLRGPVSGLTAWTMTRVEEAPGSADLRLGLGVLLALVLGLAAWLTWLIAAWTGHVRRIESALAGAGTSSLPRLKPTGEKELDRIVAALNLAGERLEEARRQSEALTQRVALSERLAALGRVTAGVAHEIRNPIAAMRLRAENALAGDPARRGAALEAVLAQIARLDRLIAELLAMTQRRAPVPEDVALGPFLQTCADDHRKQEVAISVQAEPKSGRFDPVLIRRALDNLVENAMQHTPPGGTVTIAAAEEGSVLRFTVSDTGPGIAPDLRGSLFEPFVTGRANGTGLGLAIARELSASNGGKLTLREPESGTGAVFVLEIPQEVPCTRS
jgi:signal transduction histidine kinase